MPDLPAIDPGPAADCLDAPGMPGDHGVLAGDVEDGAVDRRPDAGQDSARTRPTRQGAGNRALAALTGCHVGARSGRLERVGHEDRTVHGDGRGAEVDASAESLLTLEHGLGRGEHGTAPEVARKRCGRGRRRCARAGPARRVRVTW